MGYLWIRSRRPAATGPRDGPVRRAARPVQSPAGPGSPRRVNSPTSLENTAGRGCTVRLPDEHGVPSSYSGSVPELVAIDEIRAAAGRLAGVTLRTQLVPFPRADPGLLLKPESLQPTGSFKLRGASVASAYERQRPVKRASRRSAKLRSPSAASPWRAGLLNHWGMA